MLEFPEVAMGHLPAVWWHAEGEPDGRGIHVEPLDVMLARMEAFTRVIMDRPESRIAIVGHATFFNHLTGVWLRNCEVFEWRLNAPAETA